MYCYINDETFCIEIDKHFISPYVIVILQMKRRRKKRIQNEFEIFQLNCWLPASIFLLQNIHSLTHISYIYESKQQQ